MKVMDLAVAVFIAAMTGAAIAAVKPGENIVLNGRLEADQVDMPLNWVSDIGKPAPKWLPSGGPGGIPAIRFSADAGAGERCYRQNGLGASSNGTYRISCWARTKGFKAKMAGCVLTNLGWSKSAGPKEFPENSDWTKYEVTFRCFPSAFGNYGLIVFVSGFTGEIDFADIRMEAVDEAAFRETKRSILQQAAEKPRFVPWSPLLYDIDRTDPKIRFRFFGKPLETRDGYEAVLTLDGRTVTLPLGQYLDFTLPGPKPEGMFTLALRDRAGGTNVCEKTFPYGLADHPKVSTAGHRKLNNLVTEVLAADLKGAAAESFDFATVRQGWVFLRVSAAAKDGFLVTVDGQEVMDRDAYMMETVRYIPAGRHKLVVRNASAGRMVVRSIGHVYTYCPGHKSNVDAGDVQWKWEFQKKYAVPAITTYHGGHLEDDEIRWLNRQGRIALNFFHTAQVKTGEELVALMEKAAGMNDWRFGGDVLDEQSFGRPTELAAVTDGIWQYMVKHPENARFPASATIGKPCNEAVDQDYFAACANLCHGHGGIDIEAYYRTKATEEEAKKYLLDYGGDIVSKYREWYPLAIGSTFVGLGTFTQMPTCSLIHHPEVDYKRFLDLQMHAIATEPVFEGIGGVGYWGSYYGDEEFNRWAYMILRHYAIEGRTDLPSDALGFRYNPDHVLNGDFRGTFAPWTVEGDVVLDRKDGMGWNSLRRYGGSGDLGDTFACFRRGESPNRIRQALKGLVPGRRYKLQLALFDAKDMKSDVNEGKRIPLAVRLGRNTEIDEDLSWVWVDDHRPAGNNYNNVKFGKVSVQQIVFRAKAETVGVEISDAEAEPGRELGVNSISVNPYFED